MLMSIQISFVKTVDAQPELLRLAAHFVEGRQTVVNIERGILQAFRHDRPGKLLKFKHELHVLLARLRIQVRRKTKKQNVAKEIENLFLDRRIASLGRSNRALDHLSIFIAHRVAGSEIGSIRGETGNRLAHCSGERLESEITIPSI